MNKTRLVTVLCKSNANEICDISHFVVAIFHRYIRDKSLGLPLHENDNFVLPRIHHKDILFAYKRDFAPVKNR